MNIFLVFIIIIIKKFKPPGLSELEHDFRFVPFRHRKSLSEELFSDPESIWAIIIDFKCSNNFVRGVK
jgi:hypothetical protein